jgi:hypothetical protein
VETNVTKNLSTLNGDESASRSGCFTLGIRALGTYWIGGWMHPRGSLDAVSKNRKISALTGSRSPVVKPLALSLYRLSRHSSCASTM